MVAEKCVWIGIGTNIKKEDNLYIECKAINNLLTKKYGNLILFSKTNEPHLNLYDLDIPKKNLKQIKDIIQKIASNYDSFELKIKSVNYFPFGLFFIEIENDKILQELHEKIVKEVSQLKGDCICEDYLKPQRNYDSEQKDMLQCYGNPHVLKQFKPHITLGLAKGKNLDLIRLEIEKLLKSRTFLIDNFHIVVEENKNKLFTNFKLTG
jgi:2'-5' RNA ligase